MNKYLAAINAYAEATKKNVVDTTTIEERSRICLGCPQRVKTRGMSRVSKILGVLSGKHGVDKGVSDFSCNVCSCSLLLLLPALKENLHKDTPEEAKKRPEYCWITKA
jgi:hypothetical protein